MSFPYTQCISAITIPAGEYKNFQGVTRRLKGLLDKAHSR